MASVEPDAVVRVIGLLKVLVVPEVRIEAVPVTTVAAAIAPPPAVYVHCNPPVSPVIVTVP